MSMSTSSSRVASVSLHLCSVLPIWVTMSWMVDNSALNNSTNGTMKLSMDG